ncbi:hypothetical protein [Kineosporia babensis]|uniref:Toxin-antitoxin system HicB family antitoxin n=1 Tax=Kineosporia babensis TaxID=499548 RepID=A0A9X1N8I0_9ACTN|nr:hypothetical protein [Kineosporia babensis]MCD5309500.1 hypothetical protein [Kineosporia babensis]
MDINAYSARLHRDLYAAGQLGGEDALVLAEKMANALDPSIRLVLLDAMVEAAGEITEGLAPGAVEVRLAGREVQFAVTPPAVAEPIQPGTAAPAVQPPAATGSEESEADGGTARLSLRLPERLKGRVEEAAGAAGLSVNAWLVRSIAQVLEAPTVQPPPAAPSTPSPTVKIVTGQHITGWVR